MNYTSGREDIGKQEVYDGKDGSCQRFETSHSEPSPVTDAPQVQFTKMQGTGNDFLVVDNRALSFPREELARFATRWCARRFGVGADGLLALDDPVSSSADYRMHYVNADGSWATMCGNGARCLARFAVQNGISGPELVFDTDAGLYRAVVLEEGDVRLFVPDVTDIRLDVDVERGLPDGIDTIHFANAGTEHLVAFVNDPTSVPVETWGKELRRDPAFAPEGANVNFVGREGLEELRVRTYEKGVEAETLSCGTGVLAVATVARRCGLVDQTPIAVRARGGTLRTGTAPTARGEETYLEGPAVTVYRGAVPWPAED